MFSVMDVAVFSRIQLLYRKLCLMREQRFVMSLHGSVSCFRQHDVWMKLVRSGQPLESELWGKTFGERHPINALAGPSTGRRHPRNNI